MHRSSGDGALAVVHMTDASVRHTTTRASSLHGVALAGGSACIAAVATAPSPSCI